MPQLYACGLRSQAESLVAGIKAEVAFLVIVESMCINTKAFAPAKIGLDNFMNDIDLTHFKMVGKGTECSEVW